MIDIDAIFKNKQLDVEKLSTYGFTIMGEDYIKDFPIIQYPFCAVGAQILQVERKE